jgi:Anti-sigma factor NepR
VAYLAYRGESMTKRDTADGEAEAALAKVSGQLKEMFDVISDQPVPEHLLELVEALEEKRRYQQSKDEEF